MEQEQFEEIRGKLIHIIRMAEKTIDACRRQDISIASDFFTGVVIVLESLLEHPSIQAQIGSILVDFDYLSSALSEGDYVVLSDYLEEILLKPIYAIATRNVEGKTVDADLEPGYELEYTSTGVVTLAKTNGGVKKYLHANNSPNQEAIQLAHKWQRDGVGTYVIAGLGLGYYLDELVHFTESEIYVYEEDEKVIGLAKKYSDCRTILEMERVHIIYDPGYVKFSNRALEAEQESLDPLTGVKPTCVCFYYPSIATIFDDGLRHKMHTIFLQRDNANRWKNSFLLNFASNVRSVNRCGDELKSKIEGKRVFLIAGGPSLDKNIHLLKDVKKEDVVIAVGTSLKRCVANGIPLSYVFTTDPKPFCAYQFEGMETCKVPMILLSTAYSKIVSSYEGDKYIVFQHGLKVAEQWADEHGYHLYESGSSVTTTALDFLIEMKAKEIIFLGLDLANTGGKSHHSGTAERRDTAKQESIVVEDINGGYVGTTNAFNEFRIWIENRISKALHSGQDIRFVDATEGGAKIKGTEITSLSDVL